MTKLVFDDGRPPVDYPPTNPEDVAHSGFDPAPLPVITYKDGWSITLERRGNQIVCRVVMRVLDCHGTGHWLDVHFEKVVTLVGADDGEWGLPYWVNGFIAEIENHETRHWLKIDGKTMREIAAERLYHAPPSPQPGNRDEHGA